MHEIEKIFIKGKNILNDNEILIPITSISHLEKRENFYFVVIKNDAEKDDFKYPHITAKVEDVES